MALRRSAEACAVRPCSATSASITARFSGATLAMMMFRLVVSGFRHHGSRRCGAGACRPRHAGRVTCGQPWKRRLFSLDDRTVCAFGSSPTRVSMALRSLLGENDRHAGAGVQVRFRLRRQRIVRSGGGGGGRHAGADGRELHLEVLLHGQPLRDGIGASGGELLADCGRQVVGTAFDADRPLGLLENQVRGLLNVVGRARTDLVLVEIIRKCRRRARCGFRRGGSGRATA